VIASGRIQPFALVALRTLIGWHFLYEGYYKLLVPGWSQAGAPLAGFSAAGYLKAATGPFAGAFHAMAQSGAIGWIDVLVPIALIVAGLSLMLGLFTQFGCWLALGLLTLFYLAAVPTHGTPMPNAEGTYLLVNKTLVEWGAVLVVTTFRTGRIAGLDLLLRRRMPVATRVASAP
jgi:thiosulfate dehydrogenase (quinone) large subunit